MKSLLLIALFAACRPPASEVPRTSDIPIESAPKILEGASHAQLLVMIDRDIVAEDGVDLVVRDGSREVLRQPIVARLENRAIPERIARDVDLPVGDYQLYVGFHGQLYTGDAFRIVRLPVWGGGTDLQVLRHGGDRVSLAARTLSVARWWAEDVPAQPWIVEWRRDGRVAAITSGRERDWQGQQPEVTVDLATSTKTSDSIWRYGERYELPAQIAREPGTWEARIVRAGTPPIAVSFVVRPDGTLAELAPELVQIGRDWIPAASPLDKHLLPAADVAELVTKLASIDGAPAPQRPSPWALEPEIPLTAEAVRALFRSKELAKQWRAFIKNNVVPGNHSLGFTSEQERELTDQQKQAMRRSMAPEWEREDKAEISEKRAQLRALRPRILKLIAKHGGPWTAADYPQP